jgi:hypothetical protein
MAPTFIEGVTKNFDVNRFFLITPLSFGAIIWKPVVVWIAQLFFGSDRSDLSSDHMETSLRDNILTCRG